MLFFWFAEPIADDHSGCPKACAPSLAAEISFFSLYLKVAITGSLRIIHCYQSATQSACADLFGKRNHFYIKFTKILIRIDTFAIIVTITPDTTSACADLFGKRNHFYIKFTKILIGLDTVAI